MSLVTDEKLKDSVWPSEISNEAAKKAIAQKLVSNLKDGDLVGVGSGSTAFVTLLELVDAANNQGISFSIVGTSVEIERAAMSLGVTVVGLGQSQVAWSFDGADEVDPAGRLIKGRGGAMFREKLLMASSSKAFILADKSKNVGKLGEKFAVPVEVLPVAIDLARASLESLGATEAPMRAAGGKDGPVVTEYGGVILDVKFSGDVPSEKDIESIPGVTSTGLFDRWSYELIDD